MSITIDILAKRRYRVAKTYTAFGVDVPAGFEFDGASVPRLFWWLLPPLSGESAEAAALHDYLYTHRGHVEPFCLSRMLCDKSQCSGSHSPYEYWRWALRRKRIHLSFLQLIVLARKTDRLSRP